MDGLCQSVLSQANVILTFYLFCSTSVIIICFYEYCYYRNYSAPLELKILQFMKNLWNCKILITIIMLIIIFYPSMCHPSSCEETNVAVILVLPEIEVTCRRSRTALVQQKVLPKLLLLLSC